MNCNCTFVWHSVVPPTHCPNCGRCLGCGSGFAPYSPPPNPWPWRPSIPWTNPWPNATTPMPWRGTITYTTNNTVTA